MKRCLFITMRRWTQPGSLMDLLSIIKLPMPEILINETCISMFCSVDSCFNLLIFIMSIQSDGFHCDSATVQFDDIKFLKGNKKFSLPHISPLPLCLLNRVPYVLANYSWTWDISWNMFDIPKWCGIPVYSCDYH